MKEARARLRPGGGAARDDRWRLPGTEPPSDGLDRWALFLDLDGTVLDIADSPESVRVGPALRELIGRLLRRLDGALALISGRRVGDIDRLFPRLRLPVAGVHGAVRRDARGVQHHHASAPRIIGQMRNRLIDAVSGHSGLLLEDKGVSLALHYRRAPRLAGFAHRLAGDLVAQARGRFKLQPGKRIVEIKPAGRDKGTAIAEYMQEAPFRGRLPVFLGDDATDEYGFSVVNRLGGLSVKVGPGPTCARWRLRDVAAARAWLKRGLDGAPLRRRRRAP